MNFSQQLNEYIKALGCTAKELSEVSGLSPAVLSRYRTGERVPGADSEQLQMLCGGLGELAGQKNIALTYKELMKALTASIGSKTGDSKKLVKNLNALISLLDIRVSALAKSINYDASFISRVRSGQRLPGDMTEFVHGVAGYIAQTCGNDGAKALVKELVGCDDAALCGEYVYRSTIEEWLCSGNVESSDALAGFLQKLDEFNLDDYIRVIHFDEMKVPSLPFQLPTSKYYTGIEEMTGSEMDFIKATVLSKSSEPVVMYSDMPLEEMAGAGDFPKKWMYGMALMLKKGLHFHLIHNVERPFDEMMLGLESYIPMYMTGQVFPFYLNGMQSSRFHHLLKVSGSVALSGEAIVGAHEQGRYYLTKNKEDVAYYKARAAALKSKARPLMDIYRADSKKLYTAFLKNDALTLGRRHSILSSLPLYTATEEFLQRLLSSKEVSKERQEEITEYYKNQRQQTETILENNLILDEAVEMTREEFGRYPMVLAVSGLFYEEDIVYSYEDYLEHLTLTRKFAENHGNYTFKTNPHQAFRNLQIVIHEGKWVMISKNKFPTIHFVLRHRKMCEAIENMIVPVIEC